MNKNNQRIVLVTGGSAGMGLATALRFLDNGDQVIITARHAEPLMQLKAQYPALTTLVSDASSSAERKVLIAKIKADFGRIDVLFSNVGVGIFKPFTEMTEADFDFLIDTNYKATYFLLQEALTIMPDGSRLIMNCSWTHHRGLKTSSLYASTKAAISYLVKNLAIELAPRHINVNGISPGYINTQQFNEEMLGEEGAKSRREQVPQGRFGKPEEIAETVFFLASKGGDYINGQEILIDGGLTAIHNY